MMKGLLLLLAVVALAQARSTRLATREGTPAALGENPWVVHLRMAVESGGLLKTCAGSLLGTRWILTSASCVNTGRFIWVRYGVVNVWTPELVTETNQIRTNDGGLALININRNVHFTDNIAPVTVASEDDAPITSGKFCGFGASDDGTVPGETLSCRDIDLAPEEGRTLRSEEGLPQFDFGGGLVNGNRLYGVLTDEFTFISPIPYIDWIEEETGLSLRPPVVSAETAESAEPAESDEPAESADSTEPAESVEEETFDRVIVVDP